MDSILESFISIPFPHSTQYVFQSNAHYIKIHNNIFDILIKNKVVTVWDKVCNRLYSDIYVAYDSYKHLINNHLHQSQKTS
jgi:hypothetical protein